MKITKTQLKQIIREEIHEAIDEIDPDQIGALGDDPEGFHQESAQDQQLVELFSQRFNLDPQEAETMLRPGGKMDRVVEMMTSNEEWSSLSIRQQWARMGKWIFGTGMSQ
jgi:hypothetical protein